MKHLLRFLVALPLLLTSLTACIQADELPSTPRGDFEALWKIIDEHYCFFDYKHKEYGLDWNEVHRRYAAQISDSMSKEALFQVLGNLCSELRDGHVNLWTPFNTARYTQWYEAYPTNFDDSLQRVVLGPADEHRTASGLQYKVLPGNVGYIRCSSFNTAIGEGNLHEILRYFALCNALIVDIRSNGGGQLTSAETLASAFTNRTLTVGYLTHKTGPAHDAFSTPKAVRLSPLSGFRWQKPVAVLINRRTYSAANAFTMYMKTIPGVILVGDRTGGGSGLPFSSELPGGWSIRLSASPTLDVNGEHTDSASPRCAQPPRRQRPPQRQRQHDRNGSARTPRAPRLSVESRCSTLTPTHSVNHPPATAPRALLTLYFYPLMNPSSTKSPCVVPHDFAMVREGENGEASYLRTTAFAPQTSVPKTGSEVRSVAQGMKEKTGATLHSQPTTAQALATIGEQVPFRQGGT